MQVAVDVARRFGRSRYQAAYKHIVYWQWHRCESGHETPSTLYSLFLNDLNQSIPSWGPYNGCFTEDRGTSSSVALILLPCASIPASSSWFSLGCLSSLFFKRLKTDFFENTFQPSRRLDYKVRFNCRNLFLFSGQLFCQSTMAPCIYFVLKTIDWLHMHVGATPHSCSTCMADTVQWMNVIAWWAYNKTSLLCTICLSALLKAMCCCWLETIWRL